ncbi:MAG TPA: hypothetical protein PK109_01710 [Candidatus Paceibacterota bacterium]|nr:hypothetical protein [Candidatus Paceibacterota bacterium]
MEGYKAPEHKPEGIGRAINALEKALERHTLGKEGIKRLAASAGKAVRYSLMGAMFLGLAGAGNHIRTRYEVTTTENGGEFAFTHPDEETTHLIEFLTGREDATEEFKLLSDRETLRREYAMRDYEIPENIEHMTREEIRAEVVQLFEIDGQVSAEAYADTVLGAPYARIAFDPAMHRTVWETFAENGAPRVRLATAEDDSLTGRVIGNGRAHYDPLTNTLYINPSNPRSHYLDELAHARQFDQDPAGSYALVVKSLVETLVDAVRHRESLQDAQHRQYSRPGTLEHNAHGSRSSDPILTTDDLIQNGGMAGEIIDSMQARYHELNEERNGPQGGNEE